MCFVLGFSLIFGNTLFVSAATPTNLTLLAQHSYSLGSLSFIPTDTDSYLWAWTVNGSTYSGASTQVRENYDIDIPIFVPLVTSDDDLEVDFNRYYCIAPWVTFSGANISPWNVYLHDEQGHVFFPATTDSINQSYSPNGNSLFGKGSGVFYRGVDLYCPFFDTSTSSGSVLYGKYLYLHFTCSRSDINQLTVGTLSLTSNSWFLGIPDSMNSALQNQTSDKTTQSLINQQNQLQQQTIDKQTESNTIAQENSDTNKDTNNKITNFFNSFFDNLVHIFVPEDGFFSQWFNSLNDFMAQKLGFLWSPFDFLLSFLNGVYSGSGSASIVFPELAWIDGTVIIPRTEFSFDNIGGESFQSLRDMIYFATDVILLGAVISQFYKKIKLVFEGGGD